VRRRWRAVLGVGWALACGAAVPVGGCSKGCGACARSSDDVARVATHSDDVTRAVRHTDDIARPTLHATDDVVKADGVARIAVEDARAFDDLGRAMDEIVVTPQQYDEVMSAYDVAETAIETGLAAIDAGDDEGDIAERGQLVVDVTEALEAKLIPILGRDLDRLYQKIGRPEIFVARAKTRKLRELMQKKRQQPPP